jgi:predicted nucleic acid-binding protein
MAWVLDTSVLLDIRMGHPLEWAEASASCLEQHSADGLLVCPVTLIEMAPAFRGDFSAERSWLENLGISSREPWLDEDTEKSHALWNAFVLRRRAREAGKRPVADVLIAGFALRFQGVITRNEIDFRSVAPQLTVINPAEKPGA